MSAFAYHFELAFHSFQIIYIKINRYFNVILLSWFSHIFMHTYICRHNIENYGSAWAYAFKLAFYPFQIIIGIARVNRTTCAHAIGTYLRYQFLSHHLQYLLRYRYPYEWYAPEITVGKRT